MLNPSKNWQGAERREPFKRLEANGYIIRILNVIQYNPNTLRLSYDIAEGNFADYWRKNYDRWGGTWKGSIYVPINQKNGEALQSFKDMIYAFENSNPTFKWNWDETQLKGLVVGAVLREEEYEYNDEIRTSLKVDSWRTIEEIRSGDFVVKDIKRLEKKEEEPSAPTFNTFNFDINDNDIQF